MSKLRFRLEHEEKNSAARAASFTTLHGEVHTPVFMPVGTQATVKSQTKDTLKQVGSSVLLANTYHLLLRPGPEVFKKMGGIHNFMRWDGPVLTDSGGFQIFSLPNSRQLNEDGARFKSYVNGESILLTPELSIETQKAIGSDIMMVLDQCIPSTAEYTQAKNAMELTHRWARRSLIARGNSEQSLFGIVQGACFKDLRKQSAEDLTQLPFDGFAIGGLAVGESKSEREDFAELTASLLPKNLPRYLMGVGTPIDILEAVHRGIDMFDCILPSQLSQRGVAFTSHGKLQLRRSVYKFSEDKLDQNCNCDTCTHYSRAYLHHLIKADEVLGWHLLTLHNLTFYHKLMGEIRNNIVNGSFEEYYQNKRKQLVMTDEDNPSSVRKNKISKKEKSLRAGNYEVHFSPAGFASVKQTSSGEVMHSVNEPSTEAYQLYVKPSRLNERFKLSDEITIWDVGLGAATNTMALIHHFESAVASHLIDKNKKLKIISFESDIDSLRLTLKNPGHFPHIQHPAPAAIYKDHRWTSKSGLIEWELHLGNFLECFVKTKQPDLVYYDPFSYKTDTELWTKEAFLKIANYCKDKPFQLFTYSAATRTRAALLAAGLFVGSGTGTGPKAETTIAYNYFEEAKSNGSLLDQSWLDRWSRSESKTIELDEIIKKHKQFLAGP